MKNWVVFNGMLLNLDHVISVDQVGKTLEVYVEGNAFVKNKVVMFRTEEDCKEAFDKFEAYVSENNEEEGVSQND